MKLEAEDRKTTLDDDAAIYSKREDRDEKTKFKNLHGAEKRRYFFDYILGKIILFTAIGALLAAIAYSIFKPKPEVMFSIAIIDNTLTTEARDVLLAATTDRFVADPDKQTVTLDYDFYFSTGTYDSRTKFMAQLTVGDIDCVIIPSYEMDTYSDSDLFVDLHNLLPDEYFADESKLRYTTNSETGVTVCAGYDISDRLAALNGTDNGRKYYLSCIATARHPEGLKDFLEVLPTP